MSGIKTSDESETGETIDVVDGRHADVAVAIVAFDEADCYKIESGDNHGESAECGHLVGCEVANGFDDSGGASVTDTSLEGGMTSGGSYCKYYYQYRLGLYQSPGGNRFPRVQPGRPECWPPWLLLERGGDAPSSMANNLSPRRSLDVPQKRAVGNLL